MNALLDQREKPKPEFWYGLPYGYAQVDLQPSPEGIQEVARQLSALPDDLRDRADQVFRLYAIVLTMLRSQDVMGCALGMHPDEQGGASLSDVVKALNAIGATPQDLLAILQAMKAAGSLRAELEVI